MYKYRISVIMPCYNSSQHIKDSVMSIIGQSFQDWELIIVDDASSDNTLEIISNIFDKRIKIIRLKKNRGNYYARNKGIKIAKGKYITMLDSDDIAMNHRLEIQYDFLEKNKHIGGIGTNFSAIDQNGNVYSNVIRTCTYSKFKVMLLKDNYMLQSSIMIRSHSIRKHKLFYNTKYTVASDYDFIYQCSKKIRIFNIDDILVKYRIHENNITNTKRNEQINYSNTIRSLMFKEMFGKVLNVKDYSIINKAFSREIITINKYEIDHLLLILNRILDYNLKNKIFQPTLLYNLFEYVLLVDIPTKNRFNSKI
ncbi:hypothetical protein CMU93_03105 [Elizabethkingia anophelis]|nr:hypothetical protein [Elizabethkingia anophelis]